MWLVLAFCSAALLGLYDVCKKTSLQANPVIPVLTLNTLFCTLIFLPMIIGSALGCISQGALLYVPHLDAAAHGLILLKALLVLSSWMLGYIGIKYLPITIVGPINATRPVMVLIGAVLIFGERLNLWQWAGVAVAILSFFLLSRTGRKEGIRFGHNKWIACIVLAAVLGAMSGLYDKYLLAPADAGGVGLDKMAVQSWYNLYQLILMTLVLLLYWIPRRDRETPFSWRWTIIGISVALSAADFLYFYALSMPDAMISIVSMVRRASVLVSFVIGAIVFREHHLKAKAVDLALVLLSMILLAIGSQA